MRKILQICASLRIGGAEQVAREIGHFANKCGAEVHYLVFGDEVGEYEPEVIAEGAKVLHLPSPYTGFFRYIRSLKHLIYENHYDIVHAHTMFNSGWAMIVAKRCKVPVRIAHAHSAWDVNNSCIRKVYERLMQWLILSCATHLVACGDKAGVRLYGEKAYKKSGICIMNGIDTDLFSFNEAKREIIRESHGIQNCFVIGHVGHMVKVKNQTFLVQLMPEILKRIPNAKLMLLGDGEDRPALEQMIQQLNIDDSVIIIGNVRNVSDYLSAMDVFAFPSLFEGMPLSIIEAQANGLPCVLSTGVPKDVYLTDLIRSLPLEQAEKWIDTICSIHRRESKKYSRELKEKGYDTLSVMDKFMKIYEL